MKSAPHTRPISHPRVAAGILLVMLACCASARGGSAEAGPTRSAQPSAIEEGGEKAGQIVTQPVRDVGVAKTAIPPILVKAKEDPYSLVGLETCTELDLAMDELNEVLGPDFASADDKKENRAGKLAEAGGKTIVNALIPFRGLIREISGAAPAKRRLDAAIDAGFARRGFLRGVYRTRDCTRWSSHPGPNKRPSDH